jgi:methyl-accepting chemotaxis protein
MKLRIKILSGFIILALMLMIAGVWSMWELSKVGVSVKNILDENFESIESGKNMVTLLENEEEGILLTLQGNWDKGRSLILKSDEEFTRKLNYAFSSITIEEEKEKLNVVEAKYEKFKTLWEQPLANKVGKEDLNWFANEVRSSFKEVKKAIIEFVAVNERSLYKTATNLETHAAAVIMPGIIAFISALIFTFLFNYFVNYYFVSPIIRITKSVRRFIKNSIPYEVKIETEDEIKELSEAIENLVAYVGETGKDE